MQHKTEKAHIKDWREDSDGLQHTTYIVPSTIFDGLHYADDRSHSHIAPPDNVNARANSHPSAYRNTDSDPYS